MFTWICPQCGREVPPSYNECPDCASGNTAQQPKQAPPAGKTERLRRQPRPKRPRKSWPGWALTLLFAVGFVALGVGGYYASQRFLGKKYATASSLEEPSTETAAPVQPSLLTRYIEITGLRLTEDTSQKAVIQFVVVNHSGAEVADLAGTVDLRETTAKPDDPPMGTFSFKVASLGPYETRDMKANVQTKLRAYELPDWQFLKADVKVTSPAGM